MYKTLNNCVAKFIISNSVTGNPKFTFIRMYNAYVDKDFESSVFDRLYKIVRNLLIECHSIEDILFAIDDCPVVVKYWLKDYVEYLKSL